MAQETELTWGQEVGLAHTHAERRRILLKQLEKRFQSLPKEILCRIATANLEQLESALDQVLEIKSPEELRF